MFTLVCVFVDKGLKVKRATINFQGTLICQSQDNNEQNMWWTYVSLTLSKLLAGGLHCGSSRFEQSRHQAFIAWYAPPRALRGSHDASSLWSISLHPRNQRAKKVETMIIVQMQLRALIWFKILLPPMTWVFLYQLHSLATILSHPRSRCAWHLLASLSAHRGL